MHHFAYPYPLTDIAFSADDRWLAASGESLTNGRAALWIYDATDGRLVFSKALVDMLGKGLVRASPMATAPGDFVYSNGDSLYLVDIDNGQDLRFYHRAGAYLPELTVRQRVVNRSRSPAGNWQPRRQWSRTTAPRQRPEQRFACPPFASHCLMTWHSAPTDGRSLLRNERKIAF